MNALLVSSNWLAALVITLLVSAAHYLDGDLGPDDIATEQAVAADLQVATTQAQTTAQLSTEVQP